MYNTYPLKLTKSTSCGLNPFILGHSSTVLIFPFLSLPRAQAHIHVFQDAILENVNEQIHNVLSECLNELMTLDNR
jgi:hypothetical protein